MTLSGLYNKIYDLVMCELDFYFNYINCLRFMALHQYGNYANISEIAGLKKILLFFSITGVDALDNDFVYNYYYFFQFFFGYKAFFSDYSSKFSLGLTTFSFKIQLLLKKIDMFFFLNIFINDVVPVLDKGLLISFLFSTELKAYGLVVKDMSIFNEKKTNIGLFNLEHNLNMRIFFTGIDIESTSIFLNSLKMF